MMNRGRYHTRRVVDHEGHTIEKLLVDSGPERSALSDRIMKRQE
jgi:hypothetical protein